MLGDDVWGWVQNQPAHPLTRGRVLNETGLYPPAECVTTAQLCDWLSTREPVAISQAGARLRLMGLGSAPTPVPVPAITCEVGKTARVRARAEYRGEIEMEWSLTLSAAEVVETARLSDSEDNLLQRIDERLEYLIDGDFDGGVPERVDFDAGNITGLDNVRLVEVTDTRMPMEDIMRGVMELLRQQAPDIIAGWNEDEELLDGDEDGDGPPAF